MDHVQITFKTASFIQFMLSADFCNKYRNFTLSAKIYKKTSFPTECSQKSFYNLPNSLY